MTPLLMLLISWITVSLYYLPALLDRHVDICKYKIFVTGLYLITCFVQSAWLTTLAFLAQEKMVIDGYILVLPALVGLGVQLLA